MDLITREEMCGGMDRLGVCLALLIFSLLLPAPNLRGDFSENQSARGGLTGRRAPVMSSLPLEPSIPFEEWELEVGPYTVTISYPSNFTESIMPGWSFLFDDTEVCRFIEEYNPIWLTSGIWGPRDMERAGLSACALIALNETGFWELMVVFNLTSSPEEVVDTFFFSDRELPLNYTSILWRALDRFTADFPGTPLTPFIAIGYGNIGTAFVTEKGELCWLITFPPAWDSVTWVLTPDGQWVLVDRYHLPPYDPILKPYSLIGSITYAFNFTGHFLELGMFLIPMSGPPILTITLTGVAVAILLACSFTLRKRRRAGSAKLS